MNNALDKPLVNEENQNQPVDMGTIYKVLKSKKFLIIYATTVLRVGFYYYTNFQFKVISMRNLKDDHFVSLVSSFMFLFDFLA